MVWSTQKQTICLCLVDQVMMSGQYNLRKMIDDRHCQEGQLLQSDHLIYGIQCIFGQVAGLLRDQGQMRLGHLQRKHLLLFPLLHLIRLTSWTALMRIAATLSLRFFWIIPFSSFVSQIQSTLSLASFVCSNQQRQAGTDRQTDRHKQAQANMGKQTYVFR